MTTWNVILIAVALATLVLTMQVRAITRSGFLNRRKWNRNAREAKAVILSVIPTGKYLKLKLQVRIQMQVIPSTGRNFVVEIKTLLSTNDLVEIQTGKSVNVRYDPLNVKHISLVKRVEE